MEKTSVGFHICHFEDVVSMSRRFRLVFSPRGRLQANDCVKNGTNVARFYHKKREKTPFSREKIRELFPHNKKRHQFYTFPRRALLL